jgi:nicotinamidase-related amidase
MTLGVPVFVTEQYPRGLGKTAEEITLTLPTDFEIIEKTSFSCCGEPAFMQRLQESGVKQVAICGIETHVCVNQTTHDLLDQGYQVHVLTDCVGSRFQHDKQAGLSKMKSSGVIPSSVEIALFEMMRDSRNPCFKDIQALVK